MAKSIVRSFVLDGETYTLPVASSTESGMMSSADFDKLSKLEQSSPITIEELDKVFNDKS